MISDDLRRAVDEFHRFIGDLPETALVEKAWGPKEVLAHLHTLDGAISRIETHIRNHQQKLVRLISRRRESHAPARPGREE